MAPAGIVKRARPEHADLTGGRQPRYPRAAVIPTETAVFRLTLARPRAYAPTVGSEGMPMGEIEDAAQRLQAALDRLEQAIEARAAADASGRDDQPAVHEALEATRAENAALQRVVETVATRLDATIDRLKAAGA